jgi:hypothetical protein
MLPSAFGFFASDVGSVEALRFSDMIVLRMWDGRRKKKSVKDRLVVI